MFACFKTRRLKPRRVQHGRALRSIIRWHCGVTPLAILYQLSTGRGETVIDCCLMGPTSTGYIVIIIASSNHSPSCTSALGANLNKFCETKWGEMINISFVSAIVLYMYFVAFFIVHVVHIPTQFKAPSYIAIVMALTSRLVYWFIYSIQILFSNENTEKTYKERKRLLSPGV